MSIEKVSTILKMADDCRTSCIAFNCDDYNTVFSVVSVAEKLNKPVICMLDPNHVRLKHWTTLKIFAETVRDVAKDVKVPVGIHLDHCSDFDYISAAMKAGFNSVMYDGSMLPVEENIENTARVVKEAKNYGVDVEAELGHVGFASTIVDQNNIDLYTKPDVAAAFCEQSGCSSVAVAIGSAHGFYKETPKLDLDRLRAINAATDVPLVLHGGSGIPADQLEIAFREGINKFNVGTEFLYLYYRAISEYCAEGHADIFDLPIKVQDTLCNYMTKKLELSRFC